MADSLRLARSRRGVLRVVVLAAAVIARFQRGNGGRGALAAVPSALGFAVALRCVWDFGWTGRGTPAPVAPPQRLVVVGFYRHVRNPMFAGFGLGWIGLWVVFGHANRVAISVVAAVALGGHLFWFFTRSQPCARSSARGSA